MKNYLFAVALCFLCVSEANAKVHWLPDYLGDNLDNNSSRESSGVPSKQKNTPTSSSCAARGYLTASQIGNMTCSQVFSLANGSKCYSGCYCDRGIFSYTKQNCKDSEGTLLTLGGRVCTDSSGTAYYTNCD